MTRSLLVTVVGSLLVTVVVTGWPRIVVGAGTGMTMGLVVSSILVAVFQIGAQQGGSPFFPLHTHFTTLGLI